MEVLQDLHWLELLVLFRDIEKKSSADLLIATLWIILGCYLTVSNARKYIQKTVDMLMWGETVLEAEKILFKHCILTRQTAGALYSDQTDCKNQACFC
jgi:hypothetical protein